MRRNVFIFLESVLYLSFLYCDIVIKIYNLSNILKFLSIVLCFIYIFFVTKKERNNYVILCAMGFTMAADLCLLFLNHFTLGVLCFICVQHCYLYWMVKNKWIDSVKMVIIGRIIIAGIILYLLHAFHVKADLLLCSSVFYFICMLTNTILSVKNRKKSVLFCVGMILFLICDIQVGFYNMDSYLSFWKHNGIFGKLLELASIGMWSFYLPSQVCIVLGTKSQKKEIPSNDIFV